MIAKSKQLLSHRVTARQDVKREVAEAIGLVIDPREQSQELSGLGRNTKMKSPSVKSPDNKSSLCSLCGQTYVSTMMMVRQEQKLTIARAEAQHSVLGPPGFPPPDPPPDTRFNHIARRMAEETEQGGQGGGAEEGESGVGTEAGQGEVLSTTPVDDSSDDEKVTELMRDLQNLTDMRWLRYQHSMSAQERLLPLPPSPGQYGVA